MRIVDQHSYVATKRKIQRLKFSDDPQCVESIKDFPELGSTVSNIKKIKKQKKQFILLNVFCVIITFFICMLIFGGTAVG